MTPQDGGAASGSRPAALEAHEVRKRWAGVAALDGITLAVREGETVALVGESGSGKTTLLRCFNRMVEPDGGEIRIRGRPTSELDPVELRRRTGYVQQEGGLLPHWSVARNVGLVPWLRESRRDTEAVAGSLRLVGLDPERYGDRWPRELSGGQRQRVAIARALAGRPDVLLMDEPFGALDAITRRDLQEGFLELQRELDVTTLLVTHDLHEALMLADRVAVLREGRLEQVAIPEQLVRSPATDYVGRLLSRARVTEVP